MKKISIVIPCFNEEEMIPIYYQTMVEFHKNNIQNFNLELIFVNDGSSDNTLIKIKELVNVKNIEVKYISFSRNFGKEAAMFAGLEHSSGDYIAVMDVDLQDPPEMLVDMIYYIEQEDFDIVGTRRVTRKGEPPIRSFFARCFYKIINKISHTPIVDGARDYRLMKKEVVEAILQVKEYNRFSKGIFSWVGFKTKWLEYENVERVAGETKWNFWKLLLYSIDGITAFSTVPLSLATFAGFGCCLFSILSMIIIIIRELIWQGSAYGWPSMVCIIFLLSGIQLFSIGILGQYLSKTYMETKNRPIYIIKEKN